MPQPMPPQGGPPPPEAPEQAQSGGGVGKILMTVDKALDQIKMVIVASKATNDEEKALITQIADMFGKLLSSLGMAESQGEEMPVGASQGQTVPPEAGGNKNAVPSPY